MEDHAEHSTSISTILFFVMSIAVSVGIFLLFMFLIIQPDVVNKTNEVSKRVDTVVNDMNSQLLVSKTTSDAQAAILTTQAATISGISTQVPALSNKLDVMTSTQQAQAGATTTLSNKVDNISSMLTADQTAIASIQLSLAAKSGVAANAASVVAHS